MSFNIGDTVQLTLKYFDNVYAAPELIFRYLDDVLNEIFIITSARERMDSYGRISYTIARKHDLKRLVGEHHLMLFVKDGDIMKASK